MCICLYNLVLTRIIIGLFFFNSIHSGKLGYFGKEVFYSIRTSAHCSIARLDQLKLPYCLNTKT